NTRRHRRSWRFSFLRRRLRMASSFLARLRKLPGPCRRNSGITIFSRPTRGWRPIWRRGKSNQARYWSKHSYDRRTFLAWLTTAAVAVTPVLTGPQGEHLMYGLIAKLTAVTGKRDALIQVLKEGTRNMPGCRSDIVARDAVDENILRHPEDVFVARDAVDENILWVTEIWDSETSHDASLSLPAVKDTMAQAKPLVADFEKVAVTNPVGGLGFPSSP